MAIVLKTLLFTLLVPGAITVLVPYLLLPPRSHLPHLNSFRSLGLIVLAAGVLIYLWCAWDFGVNGRGTPSPTDPPDRLVVRGLYRRVRNPMYVGVALVLCGEAIALWSPRLAVYAAVVVIAFHLRVVYHEEPYLRRKHGASFAEYEREVSRWLPRV